MIDEDYSVYVKKDKYKFVILALYVDDILLVGNDKVYIIMVKNWLPSNYEIKGLGDITNILRVKITQDHFKRLIVLSQESYIKKILK
ncbi:reverse transcriptase [Gossypium australe]|uniref:Reverse transcriptase n=1 Tax=Gossypium australe TaxID=47621 RepID=A0A5B6VB55_9ROSI|nr:reverse transcriptase [Gossypium australe]